jgi:hypothetical protein
MKIQLSWIALFCAAIALLFSVLPTAARADCTNKKNLYIRSESALKTYEEIHALNVRTLMLQVMYQNRERYAMALPYVESYSALHDAEKSSAEMVSMLCKIYGQNLEILPTMTAQERARIEALRAGIKSLGAAENVAKHSFFLESGLMVSHRIRALLREAEEIADNVERLQNPIAAEELGKLHVKEGGQAVSSMDHEQSVRLYVGSEASASRKMEMADELRELTEYYKANEKTFLLHVSLLPASTPGEQAELLEISKRQFENQLRLLRKRPSGATSNSASSCVARGVRKTFR